MCSAKVLSCALSAARRALASTYTCHVSVNSKMHDPLSVIFGKLHLHVFMTDCTLITTLHVLHFLH